MPKGISLERGGVPIGISLMEEGGDHRDLLRKEAVPVGIPRSVPIGILLKVSLERGWVSIGISLDLGI